LELNIGVVVGASIVTTKVSGSTYELIKLWAIEQPNHGEDTTVIARGGTVAPTEDGVPVEEE
jgi:hypothetical protein